MHTLLRHVRAAASGFALGRFVETSTVRRCADLAELAHLANFRPTSAVSGSSPLRRVESKVPPRSVPSFAAPSAATYRRLRRTLTGTVRGITRAVGSVDIAPVSSHRDVRSVAVTATRAAEADSRCARQSPQPGRPRRRVQAVIPRKRAAGRIPPRAAPRTVSRNRPSARSR